MFGLAVLTVSTSGSQGKRDDSSGQAIKDLLEGDEFHVVRYEIVSDDKDTISAKLAEWADAEDVDMIVTTGGTGLGRYDVTPEACLAILDKEVPGMAEAMRAKTLEFTPMAMISRSVTGIRGNTLIITLPGSTKAVQECLDVVMRYTPRVGTAPPRDCERTPPLEGSDTLGTLSSSLRVEDRDSWLRVGLAL